MRLGLLVLGLAIIALVWIFNKIQEWRVRRRVERPFADVRHDLLGADEADSGVAARNEPRLGSSPAMAGAFAEAGSGDNEPVVDIDEEIHAVVYLESDQPISGARALACLQGFRHAGRQSVALSGWRDGAWHSVHRDGR